MTTTIEYYSIAKGSTPTFQLNEEIYYVMLNVVLMSPIQMLLTEQNKLVVAVGGAPALVVLFHTYVWDLPIVVEDMLR